MTLDPKTPVDPKADLTAYLRVGRDALLWKLEGLSEYDARRPMVPTGTNLLGLIKHLAGVEADYFGDTFGRPLPEPLPWTWDSSDPNVDMWATSDESREHIVGFYRRVITHADATVASLPLEALGTVAHWPPERRTVTLHRIMIHVIAETHRHAGHADIVRELVDGAAGHREVASNLPSGDSGWWSAHRERVEQAARDAAHR